MGARTARAALTAVLVAALCALTPGEARPDPGCDALQVRSSGSHSVLHRISLGTAESREIGPMPAYVNALGYGRGTAYGLAAGFVDGAHVLAVEQNGGTRGLGAVAGRRSNPFELPESGAIAGNRWYVVEDGVLHTVDVERLRVVAAVRLEPLDFGDIDVGAADGRLYAISDEGSLVRIDPSTGAIDPVRNLPGLPEDHYGSLVIGPSGEIYASGYRGGLYRVARTGSVRRVGELGRATSSDMAGCLEAAPPPPSTSEPEPPPPTSEPPMSAPPASSEPTTSRPPRPPRPSLTTAPSARPTPAPAPPPSQTREPAPPPAEERVPLPSPPTSSAEEDESDVQSTGHSTKEKRRWALAMLVVLIGGGAAVRRLR